METSERYLELAERASEIRRRIDVKLEQSRTEGFRGAGAFRTDKLKSAVRSLREASSVVGEMPPAPPTLRARGSSFFVQIVRRALFWYTPQILRFQQIAADVAKEQLDAVEAIQREIAKLQTSIDNLRSTLTSVDDEVSSIRRSNRITTPSDNGCQECLGQYLDLLNNSGQDKIHPVIYVGERHREWLQSLHQTGFVVHALSGPEGMGELPADSAAAITAFDVIAELAFPATVTFIADCARVVRPGGIVIVRTPNSETDDLLRLLVRRNFVSVDILPNGCGLIARRSE